MDTARQTATGANTPTNVEEHSEADQELSAGYRNQDAEAALIQSARQLAAQTTPAW